MSVCVLVSLTGVCVQSQSAMMMISIINAPWLWPWLAVAAAAVVLW
jgi:hypothetical protein